MCRTSLPMGLGVTSEALGSRDAMFCCVAVTPGTPGGREALAAVARACSPRVDAHDDRHIVFDVSGLGRVLGPPAVIAGEVHRLAAAAQLSVRVAIAGTMAAAAVLARARAGITIVPVDGEAAALADLPLHAACERAGRASEVLPILYRWGLRTLGDLARLPEADVRTRLGAPGVELHRVACGRDAAPLVPTVEPQRFAERVELEWPIEGTDALAFVLGRLCDALSAALERADRGATAIHTTLRLVTRATHERTLHLPAAMRDGRVLRTLILLDLESHPPPAGIDVVDVSLDVAPGRIVQGSLLTRSLPTPEHLATLVARLSALMGDTRVGCPVVIDTHDDRAFAMGRFGGETGDKGKRQRAEGRSAERTDDCQRMINWRAPAHSALLPSAFCLLPLPPSIRRFRLPIAADVTVTGGAPAHVRPRARGLAGGDVLARAGPWRSSGRWWALDDSRWDRDVWDVELRDGVYRLARHRDSDGWEIEGVFD